jgi:isoamylase
MSSPAADGGSTTARGDKRPVKAPEADAPPVRFGIAPGDPLPLGLHECCDGFNLAVFSRNATRMTLLLFDRPDGLTAAAEIDLDARLHRTGDIWHVRLTDRVQGTFYVLAADGPAEPAAGHRFDPQRRLLDPYAALVVGGQDWADGRARFAPRCALARPRFDWQGTRPLRRPWGEMIIYETHVRGLTIDPSSRVHHPGQYLGVVEKIPYFKALGVTALELMPVQAFDPRAIDRRNPATGEALRDYWGYNPLALFAPMSGYAGGGTAEAPLTAFKIMVRELHKAGIEVILDVVFNHTAEGDERGPTYSFRGLDNAIYYVLAPDKRRYLDYTGCGNTLNCNHPVVRTMIVDCLRHWVTQLHVDGFRFDLASVLGRDSRGTLLPNPPLLEQIAEDPILREAKLIAEAWDAGGAFQVGTFPGQRWAEWNCHFRDDVRRFWRGDPGMTGRFASRLCGSVDLYGGAGESPIRSVNFITCHDGFTLNDLVSYAVKHNQANGEDNRDGADENHSENNCVEGPSDAPAIEAMRRRQIRNMLTTLLVSRGVPMLLGGDEFRRTQGGNNNAYCQDNATSWHDWRLAERHAGLVRFVRMLIALRRAHPVLTAERFYDPADIDWFGADGRAPDWDGPDNRLGCLIREAAGGALCLLFNATRETCRFTLPPLRDRSWRIAIDTASEPPDDAPETGAGPMLTGRSDIRLDGRMTVILASCRG